MTNETDSLILGGGLAGLTCGHALTGAGHRVQLLEAASEVGGLARTVCHEGFRFDLGGHRFLTTDARIEDLVRRLLGKELLSVSRRSQIRFHGRSYAYPLQPLDVFFGLGPAAAVRIVAGYIRERVLQRLHDTAPVSLEDWVVAHFGRPLFELYFREYSEKVWGLSCDRICAAWVAQRIQGLDLPAAIAGALFRRGSETPATLADGFLYPAFGIGRIAERLREEMESAQPASVHTDMPVTRVHHTASRIASVVVQAKANADGNEGTHSFRAREFVSTMPLTTLVQRLYPRPPADVLDAASHLGYRDLIVIAVFVDRPRVTDQSWIYVPQQSIPFGRLHEPTNWSVNMAPPGKTLLVAEQFCFRGDAVWSAPEQEIADNTVAHLATMGLIRAEEVIGHMVLRIPRAYPLFEVGYEAHQRRLCEYLEGFENLHIAGRGGSFRYFNMDHAMTSGIGAAAKVAQALEADEPCRRVAGVGA